MGSARQRLLVVTALVLFGAPTPASATEEDSFIDRLGGHIGVAVPLVSVADGDATTVAESTTIALPMGLTIQRAVGPLAFDMEVVPAISEGHEVDVTLHPGLIYPGRLAAVGMRAAFEVDSNAYGFTALIARPIWIGESLNLFVELDVPVRFPPGPVGSVVGVATHVGIGF
jgi:hypothetical protein